MEKTFSPKYKSKYNVIKDSSMSSKRLNNEDMTTGFVPKTVKYNKRKTMQVSENMLA